MFEFACDALTSRLIFLHLWRFATSKHNAGQDLNKRRGLAAVCYRR
jgi:hypothetical protein